VEVSQKNLTKRGLKINEGAEGWFVELDEGGCDIRSMSSKQTPEPSTRALIDTDAFRHNLNSVRAYVGQGVKILAVVKANAYGHGAVELAREAVDWGVDYLGVARVHEGIELRNGGIRSNILLFESAPSEHNAPAIQNGLELTLASRASAEEVDRAARNLGVRAKVHVKVDTGMGRLGMPFATSVDAIEQIAGLEGLDVVGIYSHFATSEDRDQAFARTQLERFNGIVATLAGRGVSFALRHMANSGAIMTLPGSYMDMVRPGIMLYGYPPGSAMSERYPVRPVLSLVSRVSFIKTSEAGTSISYGRRYFTSATTRIATVPIGYADGYPRSLTNRASAIIRGKRYPVVGTICMDHIMIDVGLESGLEEGDLVTLIGREGAESISAWDIASTIGTIPYEVTCLVTKRVPRIYAGVGN
jgi:alanine racemase